MDTPPLWFSIIVPVYNRPKEIEELLDSLTHQSDKDFEVLVVDDGSTNTCKEEVDRFQEHLSVRYLYKENSGPGLTRNYGAQQAKGNYFIFLDSDCILPPKYVQTVKTALDENYCDAFGGPDKAHEDFAAIQKAVNYSMTSFFTTGGIRGGHKKIDKFYPRSFNMGFSREVFEMTGGFSEMRFGEDLDMSIRILKNGFQTCLIEEAWVYHKRRTSLRQFFKQVQHSGAARIRLQKRHPGTLKLVHLLPSLFTAGSLLLLLLSFFSFYFLLPLLLYAIAVFIDATHYNRDSTVGALAILTSFAQLFGYGTGFIYTFLAEGMR